ncbi:hypothetical protein QQP08_006295 [Theobroma cacao]|nr:hypothetical protein QQP08_006295 [Theobroma cacao]
MHQKNLILMIFLTKMVASANAASGFLLKALLILDLELSQLNCCAKETVAIGLGFCFDCLLLSAEEEKEQAEIDDEHALQQVENLAIGKELISGGQFLHKTIAKAEIEIRTGIQERCVQSLLVMFFNGFCIIFLVEIMRKRNSWADSCA